MLHKESRRKKRKRSGRCHTLRGTSIQGTAKVRMVFDGSAKSDSLSLNDTIYRGQTTSKQLFRNHSLILKTSYCVTLCHSRDVPTYWIDTIRPVFGGKRLTFLSTACRKEKYRTIQRRVSMSSRDSA